MADNLTPEQRRRCMSSVRGRDTGPETAIRRRLHSEGFRFRKHMAGVPGRPDIVFVKARIAVFIDGDFWHGYRYPRWRATLSEFWRCKIESNRARDRRTHRKLRRSGWIVLRLWEHEVEKSPDDCVRRIREHLR